MRFSLTSFALGFAAGAATVVIGRQIRPVLLEVATAAFQVGDAVTARVAMLQEDLDDVIAEARARARNARSRAAA